MPSAATRWVPVESEATEIQVSGEEGVVRSVQVAPASLEVQRPSPSKQKYSSPRQVETPSGIISGDQERKFCTRPTFTDGS